jgi:hypothetical protein
MWQSATEGLEIPMREGSDRFGTGGEGDDPLKAFVDRICQVDPRATG